MLVLMLVGAAYVMITAYAARQYYNETTQRLNAHVAEHLLHEVAPFVNGKVNDEALGKIMHSMMAVNPSIEVYLVSPAGDILSFVVLDKDVRLKDVNLQPIKDFIASKGARYILGDDPRNPGKSVVFSATEVVQENQMLGYVYMVLASEEYENASQALFSSYFLKIGAFGFAFTLVAAFTLGMLLIYLLTRSLRKIQNGVRQFEAGDYHARIPVKGTGEMAALAHTFNTMADTILKNIDELKQVDSLRRDLIANVSHDLRSPMAVIHGYIETLIIREEKITPEEKNNYLNIILQSSDKLKKLVADLFELSRLEAKQIILKREPVLVNEMLPDIIQQFKLMAGEKEINLNLEMTHQMPRVMIDAHLMSRVFQNLLDNAIKYTPNHGIIKVDTRVENSHVKVRVHNTGIGIAPKDLPHLFDRYFKVDHSLNTQSTGLGLAIVKKIMDLHNAQIQVLSVEGASTTFEVQLPFPS
jgi:signal transduction histidine kinase